MADEAASAKKRPRRDDSPPRPGANPPKPPRSSKKARKAKGKEKDHVGYEEHRFKRKRNVSDDTKTLMMAFFLHIRIIWGVLAAVSVPILPDDPTLNTFEARFGSFDDVTAARHAPVASSPNEDMVDRLRELRQNTETASVNEKVAMRIPDQLLEYLLVLLTRYGLRVWRPDFRQTAYSIYNSAHRLIAIDTFRQLVAGFAYQHIAIDTSLLDDMLLLTEIYDHFVHYYMFNIWKRDLRFPGQAQKDADRDAMLKRRRVLAKARGQYCKDAGYPKRVVDLVSSYDGTSDDEEGVSSVGGVEIPVSVIHEKPCRAKRVTAFIRWLDEQRRRANLISRRQSRTAVARPRIVPEETVAAQAHGLPKNVPVDWYEPSDFNALPASFRFLFAARRIAFPSSGDLTLDNPTPKWRTIKDDLWQANHAPEIAKQYNIPDADTLALYEDEDDDEAAVEEETDMVEQPDLVEDQNSFARRLLKDLPTLGRGAASGAASGSGTRPQAPAPRPAPPGPPPPAAGTARPLAGRRAAVQSNNAAASGSGSKKSGSGSKEGGDDAMDEDSDKGAS